MQYKINIGLDRVVDRQMCMYILCKAALPYGLSKQSHITQEKVKCERSLQSLGKVQREKQIIEAREKHPKHLHPPVPQAPSARQHDQPLCHLTF